MSKLVVPMLVAAGLMLAACQTTATGVSAGAGPQDSVQRQIDESAHAQERYNRGRGGI